MLHFLGRVCRRVRDVYSDQGAYAVLNKGTAFFYREVIRKLIPVVGYAKKNGVLTKSEVRFFDAQVPLGFEPKGVVKKGADFSIPLYEEALSQGLRKYVKYGDRVVVVGGGWGVTGTIAARQAGDKGNVLIFEGSEEMVSNTRTTLEINGMGRIAEVRHAIVGEEVSLAGDSTGESAAYVDPKELPECDVLELDCEGAEITILENMQVIPRVIMVESHGKYGSGTNDVKDVLRENGYNIKDVRIADSRRKELCVEADIKVVTALQ